jgi:hypothetical protein
MDMTPIIGHSAHVELNLRINGARLPLSHVGPDAVVFREPQLLPAATEGELIVRIDNYESREAVVLFEGATLNSKRVKIRRQSLPTDNFDHEPHSDHG